MYETDEKRREWVKTVSFGSDGKSVFRIRIWPRIRISFRMGKFQWAKIILIRIFYRILNFYNSERFSSCFCSLKNLRQKAEKSFIFNAIYMWIDPKTDLNPQCLLMTNMLFFNCWIIIISTFVSFHCDCYVMISLIYSFYPSKELSAKA